MKKNIIGALLIGGFMLQSCDKVDIIPEVPSDEPTPTSTAAQPQIVGADGALWAVKSHSITTVAGQSITMTIGTGVAFFNDGTSTTTFVEAGDVTLNSTGLTKNDNNSYVSIPSQSQPTGISFGSDVDWTVSGGNGIPAINKTVSLGFPTVNAITSATTIDKSQSYTLTTSGVTGADSTLFIVGGVTKTIIGNATTCTFSPAELSGATSGTSVIQIAAYTMMNENVSGKNIYYGNETVQTLTAEIQ
jgi:hypothetical protein